MNFLDLDEVKRNNSIPINSTIFGDCLEGMKLIPDGSVDMVLCDLPYEKIRAKWDKQLPIDKLWEQYNRIIKDNGAILLFAQTPFDKLLGASNLKLLKYEWIWEKTQATGHFNAKLMPMNAHENILVFYKNTPTYNPQKTTGHKPVNSYTKRASVVNKTEVYGKVKVDTSGGGETDRYPRSVLKFASDKQKNKLDGTIFSTQKPLALCEYLIKTYTNEGDLILDNTAGSGTTGIAAYNTKRNFIMFENQKNTFDLIKHRFNVLNIKTLCTS